MHHRDSAAHYALVMEARARAANRTHPQAEYVRVAQARAAQRESRLYASGVFALTMWAGLILTGLAMAYAH